MKTTESLYMGAPRDPDLEAVRKKSLEDFKLIIDNNQDIDKADVLYDSVGEDERLVVIAGTAEKLTDLLSDPSHNGTTNCCSTADMEFRSRVHTAVLVDLFLSHYR
jgi:hypothetical protein